MKINVYYGGRGVIDDPTIYVLDLIENVLSELRVEIKRYNIYEQKNSVSTLANTLSGCDGIILATTVEWMGIGGHMAQFLDALWFYANKEELRNMYMMPVVISTTYGERESLLTLENAWEILGGLPCSGCCGYVEDIVKFKSDNQFRGIIEKKAENLYRSITYKVKELPNSNNEVSKTVLRTQQIQLTPQESERMSHYAADEKYVERTKQDVSELTSIYRDLLGDNSINYKDDYSTAFKGHFHPISDFKAVYLFDVEGKNLPFRIAVDNDNIVCEYTEDATCDVLVKLSETTMEEILSGRMGFLRAFSAGAMTAKGQFTILRKLDELFEF